MRMQASNGCRHITPSNSIQGAFSLIRERKSFCPDHSIITMRTRLTNNVRHAIKYLRCTFRTAMIHPLKGSFIRIHGDQNNDIHTPCPNYAVNRCVDRKVLIHVTRHSPRRPTIPYFRAVAHERPLPTSISINRHFAVVRRGATPARRRRRRTRRRPRPFVVFPPDCPFRSLSFVIILRPRFSFIYRGQSGTQLLRAGPRSAQFPTRILISLPVTHSTNRSNQEPLPQSEEWLQ